MFKYLKLSIPYLYILGVSFLALLFLLKVSTTNL